MSASPYISRASDEFIRPVAIAVIATQFLLTVVLLTTFASWALGVDLYMASRLFSALTAASMPLIAFQIWRLYLRATRRFSGLRDRKVALLIFAVSVACALATVVVVGTIPKLSAGAPQEVIALAIAGQAISVVGAALFAAKSTFSLAALFEALRVTERARLN